MALVTGAARGIGFATARALQERGATAVIVDLDARDAQRAAQAIGPRAIGFGADVTDLAAMQRVVTQTVKQRGSLDIVVANAGITPKPSSLRAMDPRLFDRVIEVNLLGVHRTVSAALPEVVAGGGHVVVTSSVYAFINGALHAPYAMSKAAVEQFGRALRAELVNHGASASVAYFGYIHTAAERDGFAERVGDSFEPTFPRGWLGPVGPDDAADAIVRGIERRAPRIFAPRRWVPMSILRGLVNPLLDRRTERNAMIQAIVRDADQIDPCVVAPAPNAP
ncbi:SDR family NAD(P)-dependent oxidoreductase [Solirubrobacter ginsenosidimutans]|uniref:SDR family NAD(P)-dependent oxidoreductase n=1 Tax=Solirubrobacter ginsenosidimutans TaxID=490573 RepID=A0A9X3MU62_9ACTN|nr:SDR family NAD(P)-dependent oxidoreductase [Solirubrobacter ginsenosidimutans]